ncbi:MAG: S9 family peptidase [bacterium]
MNMLFIISLYFQNKLNLDPPVAKVIPHVTEIHGEKLIDNYFWLRNRDDKEVIEYLETENRCTDAIMENTKELQEKLYKEMLGRIKETDKSAEVKIDDYYYYSRTEEGKQYAIHCRKKGSMDAEEEILIDENVLAEGLEYFNIGVFEVSPDHRFLAYSVDTDGSEIYTLYIKDLTTGELLKDVITNTFYSLEWANDNKTIFYDILDETKRPYKIYRHILGTDIKDDTLVYYEKDEAFYAGVSKTKSKDYLLFISESKTTSEVSYLKADEPLGEIKIIHPRQHEMEYYVDHHGDYFFILTNDSAKNFKLMKTPISNPTKENWEEVIPHRDTVRLEHIEAFSDHIVVFERENGLKNIRILNMKTNETHYVNFPEPVYNFWQGDNPEYNTNLFRFEYTSLVTPRSVFDYNMDTKTLDLKKQDEIPSGYDASQYQSERVFAKAEDGTLIPISLVYKKGLAKDGNNPLYLYGYGSYGASMDPNFSTNRLSLLDRGFIYAIAHIRGGEEMGRYWYEQGKLLNKKNTFTDFISCAEHLIAEKYTSSRKLVISGASAGGLLMGAVTNMRPDLFNTVIAKVPFVDVINTMLDPSIPLTTVEYEEWGNPDDKEYFDYIKSYSPYDNVSAKDYPNILITASLNDPRVQYWEPAKWTAKLRALKTDNNILLLKTNMGAGHGGASGRYDYLKEIAFEYAFILKCLEMID